VKLVRVSIQDPKGCCTFQVSLVTTEFVGDSFDVAAGFSVLKNGLRRLSDFPGHFFGSGRWPGWFLRGFGGPGSSGRVVWGDKPKTRHFSGNLGCVGRQHP
jgi:hypothetical protein